MAMMCPKCRTGFVFREQDRYGSGFTCLACGWTQDDESPAEFDLKAEKAERWMDRKQYKHVRRI